MPLGTLVFLAFVMITYGQQGDNVSPIVTTNRHREGCHWVAFMGLVGPTPQTRRKQSHG